MPFFDTLLFADNMKASGMSEATAKTLAGELKKINETSNSTFSQETKTEILKATAAAESRIEDKIFDSENRLEKKISQVETRISEVETKLDKRISEVETKLEKRISAVESRLENFETEVRQEFKMLRVEMKNGVLATIISLGSIITIASGVIITFLK